MSENAEKQAQKVEGTAANAETGQQPKELTMIEAFKQRHSTRNFSKLPWSAENQRFVEETVREVNARPKLLGRDSVEIVVAPTGFGLLNFIVNENGWLMAKMKEEKDDDNRKDTFIEAAFMLEWCLMKMTQRNIATCWIGGTYKKGKSIEFCGGHCDVPGVVAFGGEDQDRWLEYVVKWFGSWRGANQYKDKFYDFKEKKPITEETAGERADICMAINKIPCAMKPHAYRIVFDEPLIHVYDAAQTNSMYKGMNYFDIGNVFAHIWLYYEAVGKTPKFSRVDHPDSPLGGEYMGTISIE